MRDNPGNAESHWCGEKRWQRKGEKKSIFFASLRHISLPRCALLTVGTHYISHEFRAKHLIFPSTLISHQNAFYVSALTGLCCIFSSTWLPNMCRFLKIILLIAFICMCVYPNLPAVC